MARTVRDSALDSRTARSRLPVRQSPYVRLIERGLHLGYRKLGSGPGSWVVRRYDKTKKNYTVRNLTTPDGAMVVADDFADADGKIVLSFEQAQKLAQDARRSGPYTVSNALDDYFESKGLKAATNRFQTARDRLKDAQQAIAAADTPKTQRRLKSAQDELRAVKWIPADRNVIELHKRALPLIYEPLGETKCDQLTSKKLRAWQQQMIDTATSKRLKRGASSKNVYGEDAIRQMQASANRVFTILRAALNHAFKNGEIASNVEWSKDKVPLFENVDAPRDRNLKVEEATRLINACDPDFRLMVQAALLTGARYGQLCRLTVGDFHPDSGTLHLQSRKGKKGKLKHYDAFLTDEASHFFIRQCAGRKATELMFPKDGRAWNHSEQIRRMKDACKAGRIEPPIGFHGLRHTWASLAVTNKIPLMIVASNLGHSDTRMVEKHYAHLDDDHKRNMIRANAPKFGIVFDNVEPLAVKR